MALEKKTHPVWFPRESPAGSFPTLGHSLLRTQAMEIQKSVTKRYHYNNELTLFKLTWNSKGGSPNKEFPLDMMA